MDIREQISKLVILQESEKEIRKISEMISQVDRRTGELDSQLNALAANVDGSKARTQLMNKRYRELETELQAMQGRVDKGHEKLRSVKTNKEYQSGLKEIDDLKGMGSRIEDEMLACLDQIERGKAELAEAQAVLENREKELRSEKDLILKDADEAMARLRLVKEQSEKLSSQIPSEALAFFRRVVATKPDGNGIVPVYDEVCRGCNMNIPPQMYNELQRMDRLKNCPNCERIIYWKYKEDGPE
jgi:predicted  nucleic acid-binding Zn-ribbon protein